MDASGAQRCSVFLAAVSVGAVKKLRFSLLGDSLATVMFVGSSRCLKMVGLSSDCSRVNSSGFILLFL